MTTRRHLPQRRPNQTIDLDFDGARYAACVGYFPDGFPGEIFIQGVKPGSQLDSQLADACVAMSLMLQYGIPPLAISKSMSRLRGGEAASVIGKLADLLALEAEAGKP